MEQITRLKISRQGLIDVYSTNQISYNKEAILQEAQRIREQEQATDAILQAWNKAKKQMKNMKELLLETEIEREDYTDAYWLYMDVAQEYTEDSEELEYNMALQDALHDYKQLMLVVEALKEELGIEEHQEQPKTKSFAEIQRERLEELKTKLREVA